MNNDNLKVKQVAAFFLALNASSEDNDLTQLKLQKLLYYAQGICLAVSGKPLFDSKLHAWLHGPVCTPIYYDFPTGASILTLYKNNDELVDQLTQKEKSLIHFIDMVYGRYGALTLRHMTHLETPWKEAKEHNLEEISQDSIKDFFSTTLKNRDHYALQHSSNDEEIEDILDILACVEHYYSDEPAMPYEEFKKSAGW